MIKETKLYQINRGFARHDKVLIYFIAKELVETTKSVYLYGHGTVEVARMGVCMNCGRKLTHPVSVELGIGPECGQHFHNWDLIGGYSLENIERLKGSLIDIKIDQWFPKSQIIQVLPSTEDISVLKEIKHSS